MSAIARRAHSQPTTPTLHFPRVLCALVLAFLVGLASPGCGPSTQGQLAEIRALQEAGQYEASIAPLRKLLSMESDDPEANLRLGIALQQTGRPSLAVWPLQKASLSDEYAVQAGLILAGTLSMSESFQESIRAYARVIENDPDNTAALFGLGRAQLSTGNPAAALESANRLLALRPDDQRATALKGSALLDLDRGDEAETALKQVFERAMAKDDPADAARKCAGLGLFYRSQEAETKAHETFLDCAQRYPTNPQLRQHASDFFIAENEPDLAIKVWRDSIAATPEDLGLRAKLAEILATLGRDKGALAVLQESVELFDSPEAWRMLGGYQRVTGNPTAARESLEESIARSRNVAPSQMFTLADMLIEEGNYDRASEIAESLEEPSYRAMIRGTILLKKGDPAGALALLEAGLKLYPNNSGARYLAGSAALATGDAERALGEFREAVRIAESNTDAALKLAELYFRKGEYSTAMQFANRQISKRPYTEPTAHIISARSAIILGQYDRAAGTLGKLRQLTPGQPASYLEFAALKRKTEGPEASIAVLMEGEFDLALPKNEAILQGVTQDYLSLGEGNRALELVDAGLSRHPEFPGFHDLRGRILAELGRIAEAHEAFSRGLALNPDYAPSLESLGRLALGQGNAEGAASYFGRAARSDPASAKYLYAEAQVRYRMADLGAAERLFRGALELDPSHVGANNDLAWLMASQGNNLDAALDYATRAARLDMNADTLDTLGFAHLQAGDAKEAVGVLGKALEMRPDSPSIKFRLGMALAATGDEAGARDMLSQALQSPDFPEAKAAAAELAKLQES